jgi:hypothetical protein
MKSQVAFLWNGSSRLLGQRSPKPVLQVPGLKLGEAMVTRFPVDPDQFARNPGREAPHAPQRPCRVQAPGGGRPQAGRAALRLVQHRGPDHLGLSGADPQDLS